MDVFFTSDLHLGHENALRFDNRCFANVDEMNAELVKRWNAKVKPGDIVYVLGDMIWKMQDDQVHKLLNKLNGQIILIKGNHDRFIKNAKTKKMLAGIKDMDDISVELKDGTIRRVVLCHSMLELDIMVYIFMGIFTIRKNIKMLSKLSIC